MDNDDLDLQMKGFIRECPNYGKCAAAVEMHLNIRLYNWTMGNKGPLFTHQVRHSTVDRCDSTNSSSTFRIHHHVFDCNCNSPNLHNSNSVCPLVRNSLPSPEMTTRWTVFVWSYEFRDGEWSKELLCGWPPDNFLWLSSLPRRTEKHHEWPLICDERNLI